jgi:sugar phosphate isomerase/epimerase
MNIDHFGMDTITLAGSLEAKLKAVSDAGFTQIMISARDLVGHPGGEAAAIAAIRASGLRVTGFQVLRDFEGLSGHLHAYKVDVAKAMLTMCRAVGSKLLLMVSSTLADASADLDIQARDLRKLATLAMPSNIRIAYEPLSWGRYVSDLQTSWELIEAVDRANTGLVIDSFQMLATAGLAGIESIYPERIFLVQLADFMSQEIHSLAERKDTARHFRVFPGEGVHTAQVAELVRQLDKMGYRGDYSFEVYNDDYVQLPLSTVTDRARRSVKWLTSQVARRSLPARHAADMG